MAEEKRSPAASFEVPDLDVPKSRPTPSGGASPPVSGAQPAMRAPAPRAFDDDDDGLGMEIERDVTRPFDAPAPAARPSGRGIALDGPAPVRAAVSGSGLDVAYRRLDPKPRDEGDDGPGIAARVLGPVGAVVLAGGAFAGLCRVAHHGAGTSPTSLLPSAFDGTSAAASGAVALSSLVLAIAIGFFGVRARTRSWVLVGSASLVLLLALAMVTVTLASSGERGPPPDGALLVPWLAPLAVALGGVDVVVRSAKRFTNAYGAAKLAAVPVALVAGALLFAAAESSRFASLLSTLR